MASRGVLYLDEIAEFPRAALEVLRQPLEDGTVTIARAAGTCTLPARFSLVASMNPCPRGRRGERNHTLNAHLRRSDLRMHAAPDEASSTLLEGVMQRERLRARSFDRIVRVARTIGELAGTERVEREHVAEALLYRRR